MNIYIKENNDYMLLTDKVNKCNIEDYERKMDFLSDIMDKLENMKLNIEIERQKKGGYKVLKLGVHPNER